MRRRESTDKMLPRISASSAQQLLGIQSSVAVSLHTRVWKHAHAI
jgi:hypothetical protein